MKDTYAPVNDRRQRPSGHLIADVSYSEDRLDCTCGVVMHAARAVDWIAHRKDVGEPVSQSGILGPAKTRKALRVA